MNTVKLSLREQSCPIVMLFSKFLVFEIERPSKMQSFDDDSISYSVIFKTMLLPYSARIYHSQTRLIG